MILELDLTREQWEEMAAAVDDGGIRIDERPTTCSEAAQENSRRAILRYDLASLIKNALRQELIVR